MRMHVARIAASVQIPVVADGDAGYGGVLNVQRTIELLARAGVDAVHIEDQVMPKKCGHLAGKSVVPFKEAFARMGAAIEAGNRFGVDIIARTDALSVNGVEDAVARASAFRDLGAAAIFIDGLVDAELIRIIPSLVPGPLLFNAVRFKSLMPYSATTLQGFGYACAIYPGDAFCAAASAVSERLSALLGPDYEPPLDAVGLDAINVLTGQQTRTEEEARLSNYAHTLAQGRGEMP
jgi:2,3-dimethylmalate lyase